MPDNYIHETLDETQSWDGAWESLDPRHRVLYTRGTPKTLHQLWQRCYFEDLWALMGKKAQSARYLEIGSGRGTTSMYLASRGCDVTLLDIAESGLKLAQQNFQRAGFKPPKIIAADARGTGLPSNSYDCTYNIGLLEHFEHPRAVLEETLRVLAPGGVNFSVIIPTREDDVRLVCDGLFAPWRLAWRSLPDGLKRTVRGSQPPAPAATGDVVRTGYTREEYLTLVRDIGVVDAVCLPYNSYHSVYGETALEHSLVIPLYRLHRAIKKKFSRSPWMRTLGALGSCDLLIFRKAGR